MHLAKSQWDSLCTDSFLEWIILYSLVCSSASDSEQLKFPVAATSAYLKWIRQLRQKVKFSLTQRKRTMGLGLWKSTVFLFVLNGHCVSARCSMEWDFVAATCESMRERAQAKVLSAFVPVYLVRAYSYQLKALLQLLPSVYFPSTKGVVSSVFSCLPFCLPPFPLAAEWFRADHMAPCPYT